MEEKLSCDGGHEFKLLFSCPSGLSPSQVSVVFDEAYDRNTHPDHTLEKSISEIHQLKVKTTYFVAKRRNEGIRRCKTSTCLIVSVKSTKENFLASLPCVICMLYSAGLYSSINAAYFVPKRRNNRTKECEYGGYNFNVENDPKQQPHVSLHLGLTDYRTFVGTNLSPMWERFLVPSEDDCIQCQHTSSPLGNGAVMETSDRRILVLQRSNKVGEFPGYFVFPGGHPEIKLWILCLPRPKYVQPQEVGIISHEGFQELNQCHMINSKVSQEMFDSIVREVVEEIGAPADSLSSPIFIGISRRVLNVRPTAFFFIKCNLRSEEIQQLYSSAQDSFESTQLYAVSMSDLEDMASKMPGCHRGGYALYKLMVQDTSDS
ncbi:hypothetical protein H5410_058756 [Solanum commersonii]|uniref:Nudix hydrolase domain-containing protein n=1 Tax=Solanum commersonii TaxID=4109 RepID=A0A9J5WUJ7_SOLCO|nr:hypothetical protein H5410_058756 [Solanum commersonii]